MFSRRLPWDTPINRLTERLERRRRRGDEILDLTVSNPTTVGLDYPVREILDAFDDPALAVHDPDPAGSPAARRAVIAYYQARGVPVGEKRVLITTSTSDSYAWILKILADPGDEILVPRPSYPLLEHLAALDSVRTVPYDLLPEDGWAPDMDRLEQAAGDRTRAIVVVHPNNPTGSFVGKGSVNAIAELCARRGLAIIADEVFVDYAFRPSPDRAGSFASVDRALTFTLSGLSKVAGLPQVKLAWMVLGGPEEVREKARSRLELVADTYLPASAPALAAAARLLAIGGKIRPLIQGRAEANRKHLLGACGETGAVRAGDPEGGWYGTIELPEGHEEERWVVGLLDDDGVLVQPGYFYDFPSEPRAVVSLLTPEPVFREGIRRLIARGAGS